MLLLSTADKAALQASGSIAARRPTQALMLHRQLTVLHLQLRLHIFQGSKRLTCPHEKSWGQLHTYAHKQTNSRAQNQRLQVASSIACLRHNSRTADPRPLTPPRPSTPSSTPPNHSPLPLPSPPFPPPHQNPPARNPPNKPQPLDLIQRPSQTTTAPPITLQPQ